MGLFVFVYPQLTNQGHFCPARSRCGAQVDSQHLWSRAQSSRHLGSKIKTDRFLFSDVGKSKLKTEKKAKYWYCHHLFVWFMDSTSTLFLVFSELDLFHDFPTKFHDLFRSDHLNQAVIIHRLNLWGVCVLYKLPERISVRGKTFHKQPGIYVYTLSCEWFTTQKDVCMCDYWRRCNDLFHTQHEIASIPQYCGDSLCQEQDIWAKRSPWSKRNRVRVIIEWTAWVQPCFTQDEHVNIKPLESALQQESDGLEWKGTTLPTAPPSKGHYAPWFQITMWRGRSPSTRTTRCGSKNWESRFLVNFCFWVWHGHSSGLKKRPWPQHRKCSGFQESLEM